MKKATVLTLLLILLLACSVPASAAESGTVGDGIHWTLDGDTLTVTGSGPIPDRAKLPDTARVVILEDGITEVGSYAFYWCRSLESVTLPDSVTRIGEGAFVDCSRLASVRMPARLSVLEKCAFNGCSSLTEIIIPDGVREIAYETFVACRALQSVSLPAGLTAIGERAFDGCEQLPSLILPEGLTQIDDRAFYECSSLKEIVFPASLLRIGKDAFARCDSLGPVCFLGNAPAQSLSAFDPRFATLCTLPGTKGWDAPELARFDRLEWDGGSVPEEAMIRSTDDKVLRHNEAFFKTRAEHPMLPQLKLSQAIIDISNEIVAGAASDTEKLERIFRWVAGNIQYDSDSALATYGPGDRAAQDPDTVLLQRRAVCEGYANLAQALLTAQGIPCYYVAGGSGGNWEDQFGWTPLFSSITDSSDITNHAWNEAYVDGRWVVFDATWNVYDYTPAAFSTGHIIISYGEDRYHPSCVRIPAEGGSLIFEKAVGKIIGFEGAPTSVNLPALIEGVPVVWFENGALEGCTTLKEIFYGGTQEQWDEVYIDVGNDVMDDVVVHVNAAVELPEPEPMPEPTPEPTPEPLPEQPEQPAGEVFAVRSNIRFTADGRVVAIDTYNIGGYGYYKLRDIAALCDGTAKEFSVGWDGEASVTTLISGGDYTVGADDLTPGVGGDKTALLSTAAVMVNGEPVSLTAYNIDGYNYYKLRELCAALEIGVVWDAETSTSGIDTTGAAAD
ncbi:MAG: leucine-rich repeat protein [Clostridia bacterium]|nr:leucine-rich repeat protein [Clostridia bacterium]